MPSRHRPAQTHTPATAASTKRTRPLSQAPAPAHSPAALPSTPPHSAESLPVVTRHAAGSDGGAASHGVCVGATSDGSDPVRACSAFTQGLQDMVPWLQACGVTTVAMASTGIAWVPRYERLDREGCAVLRVDPRDTKPGKGRPQTDRRDCQWIQRRHAQGGHGHDPYARPDS